MKKLIMLFLLVSFMCFGEDKVESKKSYEVVQREEIEFLKTQLIKSNNKIDDLSKKIEELEDEGDKNLGLTYNVDQIYQNSVQYYDKTISHVKWIAGIAGAIISLLLTALLGSTWYIKNNNDKKLKEEKEEVTKELDKRVERMWKENTELKEKIEEQEKEVERKTLELDEKIESTNKKMGVKIKIVEFNAELAMASNKNTPKEKVEALEMLVKKYPNEPKVYFSLAHYLLRLKKLEEAVLNYDKIIKLDSKHIGAYLNRGAVKSELGKNKEAIKDYDEIIKLNPEYKSAYFNRGNSRRNLEQYVEAIEDYDMAIKLESEDWESYHNRGITYETLAVIETKESNYKEAIKNYEEAIKNYKKTIKLDSNSIVSKENLERVQKELKKLEEKE